MEESGFSSNAVCALVFSLELCTVIFKHGRKTHTCAFQWVHFWHEWHRYSWALVISAGQRGRLWRFWGGWVKWLPSHLSEFEFWSPGDVTLGSDGVLSRSTAVSNTTTTPTTLFNELGHFTSSVTTLGKAVLSAPDYFLAIHLSENKFQQNLLCASSGTEVRFPDLRDPNFFSNIKENCNWAKKSTFQVCARLLRHNKPNFNLLGPRVLQTQLIKSYQPPRDFQIIEANEVHRQVAYFILLTPFLS